jgi:hypothetical protein
VDSSRNPFSAVRGSGSTEVFLLQNAVAGSAGCIIGNIPISRFPDVDTPGFECGKASHYVIDRNHLRATGDADDHDSISGMKEWLVYHALIDNHRELKTRLADMRGLLA